MRQYKITKEQPNLWQSALWEAARPGALDNAGDSLKTLSKDSEDTLTGLLGYMG